MRDQDLRNNTEANQERKRKSETEQSPSEDLTGFLFCMRCGTPTGEYRGSEMCSRCKAIENGQR